MAGCCDVDPKNARDLTASPAAWLLWYAPIAVIIAGSFWTAGRNWLWAGAFAVMGIGCVVNASRCRRLHCYFTGPLFLAAAGYAIAAQFGLVSLRASLFLLIVLGLACAFQCAEKYIPDLRLKKNLVERAPRQAESSARSRASQCDKSVPGVNVGNTCSARELVSGSPRVTLLISLGSTAPWTLSLGFSVLNVTRRELKDLKS